jgi:plasmid segregation protein ParM
MWIKHLRKGYGMTMQKRKRTEVVTTGDHHVTVGLDIGYGATKAVTTDQQIIFPSVAGYAQEIAFGAEELVNKYPSEHIIDDEGAWFVGALALHQVGNNELLQLQGRTANSDEAGMLFRRRMMKVALAKIIRATDGDVVHVRLATGLPVDHMRDSGLLKECLLGQHLIRTNNAQFVANIVECRVMPQPYGAIYSSMFTERGESSEYHISEKTAVVDIGRYTVDCTLDDNGEYIQPQSGSVESGMYTAQQRIATTLEQDFREKPTFDQIEETLRTGYLRAFGEPVDYRQEVNEALKPVRSATLALMSRLWKTGMGIDEIYVVGGGAAVVGGDIQRAYRQAKIMENAQFRNAMGYLRYSLYKQRQTA